MHQARRAQPDLPVILITGNTDRKVRDEMLNAGAVAVFSKPVPLGDFLDAVERGLGIGGRCLPGSEPKPEAEHEPGVAAGCCWNSCGRMPGAMP